jgi:hypothetical protein
LLCAASQVTTLNDMIAYTYEGVDARDYRCLEFDCGRSCTDLLVSDTA